MEVLRFKTNIKCDGCLSKIGPVLNQEFGEDNWEIDLKSLDKVLEVAGYPEQQILDTLVNNGFTATRI